ncbi:hypothetical protein ACF0H5_019588 [Mactra antiquata]
MDADIEENAMLKAANFARTRRSEEVRRRSRYHADVQDNFSQTDIIEDCVPAQHIYSQLRWKQTALLCSLTFTLVIYSTDAFFINQGLWILPALS